MSSCQCPVAGCVWEGVTECVDVCGGCLRRFVSLNVLVIGWGQL